MSRTLSNQELITIARNLIKVKKLGAYKLGHVGCALVTTEGSVYHGIALDLSSGLGFCAEQTAIAQMLTDQKYEIDRIVSVWTDEEGQTYILPPCGACLQFMQLVAKNKDTARIILSQDTKATLAELLPNDWRKDKVPVIS